MRIKLLVILSILFAIMGCRNKAHYKEIEHGLLIEIPETDVNNVDKLVAIRFYTPAIAEITVATSDSILTAPHVSSVLPVSENVSYTVKKNFDKISISTDSMVITVALKTGYICFYDLSGKELLSSGENQFQPFEDEIVGKQNHIIQHFNWKNDEAHYGLGQHREGSLNLKGKKIRLVQENIKVSVPFLLSSKGYALLWDNASESEYNSSYNSNFFYSEIGDRIRYYFIKASGFDGAVQACRILTGQVPMYPKWAFGYMQSRNRYRSENELITVVKRHRAMQVPLDVIILDYFHWDDEGFGSFAFGSNSFPNADEMIRQLHETYNCKILVSAWPSFTPKTKNWEIFNQKGYLLDVMVAYNSQVYDAFNPGAGKLYYNLLRDSYLMKGVDGWWFDATEPENMKAFSRSISFLGPSAKYLNMYSYFDMKNIYDAQIREYDKRIFILTRSAFTGQQRFGTTVWSGDIPATFEELQIQIPAGLNLCMTGIPYWTTDIGGYLGGNPDDPGYQELFVRWFQYGSFCPIFRSHGRRYPGDRSGENEIWSYGKRNQEILASYIRLRYRLLPYIYSLSHEVTANGYTLMRALPFDFQADTCVRNITDEFMFGQSLLVCPVTAGKVTTRPVYLPRGNEWIDFWTGEKFAGGQEIVALAPIERIPLYVRAGSIIPFGPDLQYSDENNTEPFEIRIYPGKNADFCLYEDEKDNLNYIKGMFLQIPMHYDENNKVLIIGPTKGNYPGSPVKRTFRIVLSQSGHGTGMELATEADRTVVYEGKQITVAF